MYLPFARNPEDRSRIRFLASLLAKREVYIYEDAEDGAFFWAHGHESLIAARYRQTFQSWPLALIDASKKNLEAWLGDYHNIVRDDPHLSLSEHVETISDALGYSYCRAWDSVTVQRLQ